MREPGLLYRRSFPIDMGRVVLEEKWDISAPGCPMIPSPWHAAPTGNIFVRQLIMTQAEYDEANIPLFAAA